MTIVETVKNTVPAFKAWVDWFNPSKTTVSATFTENGKLVTKRVASAKGLENKVDGFIGKYMDKFEIDLSDLDANTMYPVIFRFKNSFESKLEMGEIGIGRHYSWNRRNPSPFVDNKSTTHIAGLDLRIVGGDNPWGGGGLHQLKVKFHHSRYMPTVQLISYRARCYTGKKGLTTFSGNVDVAPTESSPVFSGFYLRGGLLYRGYSKSLASGVRVFKEPTRIYDNNAYNRSEWVAPFKYDKKNNIGTIDNL